MKRVLSLSLTLPLFVAGCYSYTTTQFESQKVPEEASPATFIGPRGFFDRKESRFLDFEPSETTLSSAKALFTGADPSFQISIEASTGYAASDGIEALGLLTLCALPCGIHKEITLKVSYHHNGTLLQTDTYKASYQVWGGLIVGAFGIDAMVRKPDLNSAIQAVLPVIAARSKALLSAPETEQRSNAIRWLKEGIDPDNVIDISTGLHKIDSAHFGCLENPRIHRCNGFNGDEFSAAAEKTRNVKVREKKYIYISNWKIDSDKLSEYDFNRRVFPVDRAQIEKDTYSYWNINFKRQDEKDTLQPEHRYTFIHDETKAQPVYSLSPDEAKRFRRQEKTLRLFALAEILPPETRERTLYACMLHNGAIVESFSDGSLCQKRGTILTKHLYFKIKRWVLIEEGGPGIQKGE